MLLRPCLDLAPSLDLAHPSQDVVQAVCELDGLRRRSTVGDAEGGRASRGPVPRGVFLLLGARYGKSEGWV